MFCFDFLTAEEVLFHRLLSSAGVASQFLRGPEFTRAERVRRALREGNQGAAVVLDAACPFAERLLVMVSE